MKYFWRVVFTLDVIVLLLFIGVMFIPGVEKIVVDTAYSVLQFEGF